MYILENEWLIDLFCHINSLTIISRKVLLNTFIFIEYDDSHQIIKKDALNFLKILT